MDYSIEFTKKFDESESFSKFLVSLDQHDEVKILQRLCLLEQFGLNIPFVNKNSEGKRFNSIVKTSLGNFVVEFSQKNESTIVVEDFKLEGKNNE